jgi:hypothetical protein
VTNAIGRRQALTGNLDGIRSERIIHRVRVSDCISKKDGSFNHENKKCGLVETGHPSLLEVAAETMGITFYGAEES